MEEQAPRRVMRPRLSGYNHFMRFFFRDHRAPGVNLSSFLARLPRALGYGTSTTAVVLPANASPTNAIYMIYANNYHIIYNSGAPSFTLIVLRVCMPCVYV